MPDRDGAMTMDEIWAAWQVDRNRIEELEAKMQEGRGPIFRWLTDEMNKVQPLKRKVAELEADRQQNLDIFIEYVAALESNDIMLQARIAELETENTRIVAESKQCHEQNDSLVSEHMLLRKRIAELEADIKIFDQNNDELRMQLNAAEAKLAQVVKLPRFNVEYGGEEIGMYRVATALGDFVDADELEALLKEEGK